MGKKVFANGMDIAHQAGDGKVVAAFPDVCLGPPPPPAGPVPVPYPDSSSSKDLKQGSTSVKIGAKPLALKDSFYQTSPLGNEAATRNFGGSVLTHAITGKTQFAAHSMDVTVEGRAVVRHLDLTTSNHASYPGGTPPFPNLSEMQQTALDRIQEGKCPCCGKKECPAAFKEGEEPLSMKEALGVDKTKPNFKPKRAEELKLLRSLKKTACTCTGKVFPSPPCDVFRAPDKARHDAIERKWAEQRPRYVKNYQRTHQTELHNDNYFLQLELASIGASERGAMMTATRLSRAERAKNAHAKAYDELAAEAKKTARINHLTPKQFGGCPDNPENLQPQQKLCLACQEIDQFMTDQW